MAISAVIFRCCRKPDWSKSPRAMRATGLIPAVGLQESAAAAFSIISPCLSGWSAMRPGLQARKMPAQASSASCRPDLRPLFLKGSFVMQSNLSSKLQSKLQSKLHVGIIMDGNGRWATRRGLSRLRGHEAGVEAIRRVVEAAPQQGVGTLTLYAFSSDNWRRPRAEVTALMALLRFYLASEVESLVRNGVRLTVIGRRDRLPDGIATAIARAEKATSEGDVLHLRIAVDYSARDAILNAAARIAGIAHLTREMFADLIAGERGLRG